MTLVLSRNKAAPVDTLTREVNTAQIQQMAPKNITKPTVSRKKPAAKKTILTPKVKKLAKVRSPKPNKPPKKKYDKSLAGTTPVAIAVRPKDGQNVQNESSLEQTDAFSHLEIEEFLTAELLNQEAANGPTIKMAKVKMTLQSENKPLPRWSPERGLHKAPKEGHFLGESNKKAIFVGVKYARIAKPKYPIHARKMGWEGTTLLRVLVNSQGETKSIEISRSSGFAALDKAAIKAVKRWRFHPARSGIKAVESWVKIPIVFNLEESKK